MKVFISADIEGVTTTTAWEECSPAHASYPPHARQMTNEVLASCEGAMAAGAAEILIRDAHGGGRNIDPAALPACASILRGVSGHPYLMAEGIDPSFDAALFIGYHSAAGRGGNPLSHTISKRCARIAINGRRASEFMLYSWACALEGVPTVFLAGDKMLCEDYADLHPRLIACPVKDGSGSMTRCYSPQRTLPAIRDGVARALGQDLRGALPKLPDHFDVALTYREHEVAERASYFPGVKREDEYTLRFATDSFYEALRAILWIV